MPEVIPFEASDVFPIEEVNSLSSHSETLTSLSFLKMTPPRQATEIFQEIGYRPQ